MSHWDLRSNIEMRDTVNEALRMLDAKGPSAAAAFLYKFGVPAPVIERVLSRRANTALIGAHKFGSEHPVVLSDVLATYELSIREPGLPNSHSHPERSFREAGVHAVLDRARPGMGADSVGISIFDEQKDELTWAAISGELAPFEGRRFPRRHSMCGVCFQTAQSQLFVQPHRFFEWMSMSGIFAEEALITPLRGQRQLFFGTMWAIMDAGNMGEFTAAHLGMLRLHANEIISVLNR